MQVLIIYIDNTCLFLLNTDIENKPMLSRPIIYIYIARLESCFEKIISQ